MIKVENFDVHGFQTAVRAMRNPHDSWDRSDSGYIASGEHYENVDYVIGEKDLELMRKLVRAGAEHRKCLRAIHVSMDITAPCYWISELDTYKVGTVRNSCSFMHKGLSKPFEITDFSTHCNEVYEILSPLRENEYELVYPYETDEYKIYMTESGRKYRVYKNGWIFSEPFEYVDTFKDGRRRSFELTECKPSKTHHGYYELNLGGQKGREKWMLHRLVATVWAENPNQETTVNHIDGNKGNNSAENLEWCSRKENIQKAWNSGLYDNNNSLHTRYIKWKNGHIVVTPFTKAEMLRDKRNGMTCGELACKYEVTYTQASNITSQGLNELFMSCYVWETIIDRLNQLRDIYLETKDDAVFQTIRCLLPYGYNQRFTYDMNYEVALNIIRQRSGHKLTEWNEFVEVLKGLPYMTDLMEDKNAD